LARSVSTFLQPIDRLGAMLAFVDVNEPVAGPGTLGRNVGASS